MKLNQFAVYRVDQQTEGKVLWHLPYQEAIQQNVSIIVENYRLISFHAVAVSFLEISDRKSVV